MIVRFPAPGVPPCAAETPGMPYISEQALRACNSSGCIVPDLHRGVISTDMFREARVRAVNLAPVQGPIRLTARENVEPIAGTACKSIHDGRPGLKMKNNGSHFVGFLRFA